MAGKTESQAEPKVRLGDVYYRVLIRKGGDIDRSSVASLNDGGGYRLDEDHVVAQNFRSYDDALAESIRIIDAETAELQKKLDALAVKRKERLAESYRPLVDSIKLDYENDGSGQNIVHIKGKEVPYFEPGTTVYALVGSKTASDGTPHIRHEVYFVLKARVRYVSCMRNATLHYQLNSPLLSVYPLYADEVSARQALSELILAETGAALSPEKVALHDADDLKRQLDDHVKGLDEKNRALRA